MKSVFKIASVTTLRGNNEFVDKYNYLIKEKNYSERDARHAVARQIATVTYGVLKTGKKYDPFKRRNKTDEVRT